MKESFDIRLFDKGTISKPDAQDIPPDACIFSNNIDPNAEGELKPIKDNVEYDATITSDISIGEWIERDSGEKDLIFGNDTNIGAITDFYGTLGLNATLATSTAYTMVSDVKAVHIGTGTTPKWVGNIDTKQLGSSYGEGLNLVEANIERPYTVPVLKKIVTDGTNYYAITGSGSTIYKWSSLTANYVESSEVFEEIQSIVYDDSYLWAITKENDLYYLCKVDPDGYAVLQTSLLDGITTDFYDLGFTDGKFFFLVDVSGAPIIIDSANIPYVYSCDKPVNNNAITLTNASPNDQQFTGAWDAVGAEIDPISFVSLQETDAIGVLCRVIFPSLSFFSFDFAGGEQKEISANVIFLIGEDATYSATAKWGDMSTAYTTKYDVVMLDNNDATLSSFATDGTDAHWVRQTLTVGVVTLTEFIFISGGVNVSLGAFTYGVANSETLPSYLYLTLAPQPVDVGDKLLYSCDNSGLVYVSGSNNGELGDVSETAGVYTINNRYSSDVELIVNYNSDDSPYISGTDYQYFAVTYIYDNIQESPLSEYTLLNVSPVAKNVNIKVNISNYDAVNGVLNNRRLTGINLYAATGEDNISPNTLFRLVDSFDLTEHWVITTDTYNNQVYSKQIVYQGLPGATFEANTGFPENIDYITPSYKVSCELNSSLFIANCTHPKLDDASHTIFKSKPFRYDSFDWINEGLKVPFIPKAMVSYQGRLYVFDKARTFVINPELYIEDTITGTGITTQRAVNVNDFGLFWADERGCHRIFNGQYTLISKPIEDLFRFDNRYVMQVTYDAPSNCVLFFCADNPFDTEDDDTFEIEGSTAILYVNDSMLSFHVIKERWDERQGFTVGDYIGAITGINGETYISETEGFKECFVGSNKSIEWISQEFAFDNISQYKIFYELYLDSVNSSLVYEYSTDGGVTWVTFTGSTNIGGNWLKSKTFKFKISGTTDGVKAITIKYRGLVNK